MAAMLSDASHSFPTPPTHCTLQVSTGILRVLNEGVEAVSLFPRPLFSKALQAKFMLHGEEVSGYHIIFNPHNMLPMYIIEVWCPRSALCHYNNPATCIEQG